MCQIVSVQSIYLQRIFKIPIENHCVWTRKKHQNEDKISCFRRKYIFGSDCVRSGISVCEWFWFFVENRAHNQIWYISKRKMIPLFCFFFFWMLQEELVNNSTQTGRPSNTDENNNPDWMVFLNQNYECRLKSSTMGEMRLYPGHHKHAFTTCNRAIVSFVWANFQLIFISFDFGTICFAMIHVLIRVFHFMFGVCVADV